MISVPTIFYVLKEIIVKNILIIYPHFPPSNLAGVHRPRLFATHLPSFGWKPVILTVHEDFYEEKPDWNLVKLLPSGLRIEKTKAFRITKPRLIGDIGLRGFFQLYKAAKRIVKNEKIDFIYIPVPSFYVALMGRFLHESTGIKYGIDYIDPWVHKFPGSEKIFSRHWFSTKIAGVLERFAVKKVSLITGVAPGYYEAVFTRNPNLRKTAISGAMPYGGEASDHQKVSALGLKPYLFEKKNKLIMMYAGAMLPKAYKPLEAIFSNIAANREEFLQTEFHFIGTGKTADDPMGHNIKPLAERYGLWNDVVFEHPQRIPYLDVLVHLEIADAIFILGSTEPHYTPSKVYQGVLSRRPVLAVLHEQSTAAKVLETSHAGMVLSFIGESEMNMISGTFNKVFSDFQQFIKHFKPENVNMGAFSQNSAYAVTGKLATLLDEALLKVNDQ